MQSHINRLQMASISHPPRISSHDSRQLNSILLRQILLVCHAPKWRHIQHLRHKSRDQCPNKIIRAY